MSTIDDAIRAAVAQDDVHVGLEVALAVLLPADPNVELVKAMVAAMTAAAENTDEPFVLAEAAYDALRSHLGLTP